MDFATLENNIKQYLTLADQGIVKLLCATVIANRIPSLDPTWLFLVSSSSGGKSELLQALAYAGGIVEQDDLTAKAFVSGARSGAKETSLLYRLPTNAIMVIKDLTVLLQKDPRESQAIFSQFRMIYDGRFIKSYGTGETVDVPVRMGLIAGVTSVIEDSQGEEAAVGQRSIVYYMKQPHEDIIDDLTVSIIGGKRDKEMRKLLGESFRDFLDNNDWNLSTELPDLPNSVARDIAQLSGMSTKARSSVKRKKYSRDNPIERVNLREMPFRMAKQLANLARTFILMNKSGLTGLDCRIIYQIAIDSIPSNRRAVMMISTRFEEITLEGLTQEMKLNEESVKIYLDDLVALDLITRIRGFGSKFTYRLKDRYRQIISKFENIEMTNKVLDEDVPLPPAPAGDLNAELEENLKQTGFI